MTRRLLLALLATVAMVAAIPLGAARSGAPVDVGEVAPDFTLADQDGRRRTLSAERGKRAVVLVFYRGHW